MLGSVRIVRQQDSGRKMGRDRESVLEGFQAGYEEVRDLMLVAA
jgi:hypothetical protein